MAPKRPQSKPVASSSSRQYSISSFLPKLSASASPSPPKKPSPSTSQQSPRKPKKKKAKKSHATTTTSEDGTEVLVLTDSDDEIQLSSDGDDDSDFGMSDDEDDGGKMLPPKSIKPLQKTKVNGKGKGKMKDDDDTPTMKEEQDDDDQASAGMWHEIFTPTLASLSLHPLKLTHLRQALSESFSPLPIAKYRRLIVLSGPSGASKSSAVRLLAQEMGVEVREWIEGSSGGGSGGWGAGAGAGGGGGGGGDESWGGGGGWGESRMRSFEDWVRGAGSTAPLEFSGPPPPSSTATSSVPSSPSVKPGEHPKQLLLLEDLPNITHLPTRFAFRDLLSSYLTSTRVNSPIVLVISESLGRIGGGVGAGEGGMGRGNVGMGVGGGGARAERGESINSWSVLGDVLDMRGVREIQFNPIAISYLKKSLNMILDEIYSINDGTSSKAKPKSKSSKSKSTVPDLPITASPIPSSIKLPKSLRPPPSILEEIMKSSNGDIRSCLMSLQFYSRGFGASATRGGGAEGKKRKRGDDDDDEDEKKAKVTEWISSRESSLFLFHALGKVLYSKRWGQSADDDKKDINRAMIVQPLPKPSKPPKHLRSNPRYDKPKSKVDPDLLFAEAPVDSDVFLSYLHGNVGQFMEEVEDAEGIEEGISMADACLRLEDDQWLKRTSLTSQYSFQLAVRSTLMHLPDPVPRRKQVLTKSYLWESLRTMEKNLNGLERFGRTKEGRYEERKVSEEVGWVGLIARKRREANPRLAPPSSKENFFITLSTFPEKVKVRAGDGRVLGEKDVDDEDEEEEEADGPVAEQEWGPGDGEGEEKKEIDGEMEDEDDIMDE